MYFSNKLKALRIERNLTQEDLAQKSGMSVKTISRYESGETLPRSRKFYDKLALALDVSYEDLVPAEIDFVLDLKDRFGLSGEKDAQEMVQGVIGLMAGGSLPDQDKKAILDAIQEAYYMAREEKGQTFFDADKDLR